MTQENPLYRKYFSYALTLLASSQKTSGQLKKKLLDHFPDKNEKIIKQVIQRLQEIRLINDEQFAHDYAKNLLQERKKSPYEAKAKMQSKYLPSELINQALASAKEEVNQTDIIRSLATKKWNSLQNRPDGKQKLLSYLIRKGFPISTCQQVIQEIL